MSTLKYNSNGKIYYRNNKLLDCCCEPTSASFHEGVPCDPELPIGGGCYDVDDCGLANRIFVSDLSYCAGLDFPVCECQSLHFFGGSPEDSITFKIQPASFTNFNPDGFDAWSGISLIAPATSGKIIFSNENVLLETNLGTTILNYGSGSVYGLLSQINDLSTWSTDLGNINNAYTTNSSSRIFFPLSGVQILNYNSPSAIKPTGFSKFRLKIENQWTDYVNYNDIISPMNTSLRTAITNLPGLDQFSTEFETPYYLFGNRQRLTQSIDNQDVYDIIYLQFTGPLCGSAFDTIEVEDSLFHNYSANFIDEIHSSGLLVVSANNVPESRKDKGDGCIFSSSCDNLSSLYLTLDHSDECDFIGNCATRYPGRYIDSETGFLRCCPQRGLFIGPDQYIEPTGELENTIVYQSKCYSINPAYFLFDMEGRLSGDYILPNCDYEIEGDCASSGYAAPCNCSLQLFSLTFNKDLPWGPFGSYQRGIDSLTHPNQYVIDFGLPEFNAGYFRPSGSITTHGTWLDTKEIIVHMNYWSYAPFDCSTDVVGGDCADATGYNGIDRVRGDIINTAPFTSKVFDSSSGIMLTYSTTGKTVGDFVDAMNAIRTQPIFEHSDESCKVFQICLASEDVRNIPLKDIINNSADIWQSWKDSTTFIRSDGRFVRSNYFTNNWEYRGSDPSIDDGYLSSATIMQAETYSFQKPDFSLDDIVLDYYETYLENFVIIRDIESKASAAFRPPFGRALGGVTASGDRLNLNFQYPLQSRPSPFFTSIPKCERSVVRLSVSDDNPGFTDIRISISGMILLYSASGSNVESSGVHQTGMLSLSRNGSGYYLSDFVDDINNLEVSGVSTTFNIFSATGIFHEDILLSHSTWTNSGSPSEVGVGSQTSINYSYQEPLLDFQEIQLISGPINLKSVVRRKIYDLVSGFTDYCSPRFFPDGTNVPFKFCVPNANQIISTSTKTNCAGDEEKDNNFIVSIGCGGNVCKEKFYIKADRCGCDTVWNGDGYSDNPYVTDEEFMPTLYVCERIYHPDCDVAALVMVPPQYVFSKSQLDEEIGEIVCPTPDVTGVSEPGFYPIYMSCKKPVFANNLLHPGYDQDGTAWCQYIDPVNSQRVTEKSIPRTFPATAYIARGGQQDFCPITLSVPVLEDPPTYNWDAILDIEPHWPGQYERCPVVVVDCEGFNPISGLETGFGNQNKYIGDDFIQVLGAAFRPVLKPFIPSDAGFSGCDRIDVDCSTKCCGCFFLCSEPSGCNDLGPKRCDCDQKITYTRTSTSQDIQFCCYTASPGCDIGPFGQGEYCHTIETEEVISVEFQYYNGCRPCETNGTSVTTTTYTPNSAGSDVDAIDCCGEFAEISGGFVCGGFGDNFDDFCNGPFVTFPSLPDCATFAGLSDIGSGSFRTLTNSISFGLPGASRPIVLNCYYQDDETSHVSDFNICGFGSAQNSSLRIDRYSSDIPPSGGAACDGTSTFLNSRPNVSADTFAQLDETVQIDTISCATCPISNTPEQTWEFVSNKSLSWQCGLINVNNVTGIPEA